MKGIGWRLVRLASWRTLLVMALTMGVLGMQTGRGTLAYFTDSVASTGNILTAGQLKLLLNGTNPTGVITLNASSTKLKPGSVLYAYWTIASDNTNNDGVDVFFNGSSNGNVQITRTEQLTATSNAVNAAAMDGRENIVVKDVTGTAAITDSTTCAVPANWTAGTNATLATASTTGATAIANRTALTSGTPTNWITTPITVVAGTPRGYCAEFTWFDATVPALDNAAKQGSNNYVITFNGASS